MDSDESRPGSSASNSSSSSNSNDDASPSSRKSRSKTRSPASRSSSTSSRNDSAPKSPVNGERVSRSPSLSKSLRSMSPDDDNNLSRSASKESLGSAASSDDEDTSRRNSINRTVSRNQSISPARKANNKSPRKSSVSSVSDDDDDERLKTDEISDGEMDSDKEGGGNKKSNSTTGDVSSKPEALNMSHEDLSDVSDLESPVSNHENENDNDKEDDDEEDEEHAEDEEEHVKSSITDLRQKLDERKNQLKAFEESSKKEEEAAAAANNRASRSPSPAQIVDKVPEPIDKKNDEDALDFEAEEGECNDNVPEDKSETKENDEKKDSDGEVEDGEELEEGEVSDEDEKRPEETEPKPVCRFYTRGQCTWGMSCRFLHPGVTDKGNYTMFDMIRPVPVPHSGPYGPPGYHDFRNDRPPLHHALPPVHHPAFAVPAHARLPISEPPSESAWERGLRTAKEMMRKAIKRKEQDMDFEDKKMNLSASQDELEKDNYYIRDRASPEASPPYPVVPKGPHYEGAYSPPPPVKYPPRPVAGAPAFDDDPYGRSARYRELPPHRMPQYEDEVMGKRRIRPAREVIVQRAEPVGRGDEWNDPWMRSKSPGRDKRSRRDRRTYSSNSSYSSSSASRSDSSSNSSRSASPSSRRRRFGSPGGHKSPIPPRRHIKRSPTPTKRRHSPDNNQISSKAKNVYPTYPQVPFPSSTRVMKVCSVIYDPNANLVQAPVRRSPPPVSRKRNISPPIPDKRSARVSPVAKRKRVSPVAVRKAVSTAADKVRKKRRSSSSGSGSSDSSGSDTGSSYSSSSSSSSRTSVKPATRRERDKVAPERKVVKKVEMTKKRSPPQPESKSSNQVSSSNSTSATQSQATSNSSKKTTRREELLKQLRAVEDAIARKRQKLT